MSKPKYRCVFCGEPILVSKHDYRTQHMKKNGRWEELVWHTKCDPFKVTMSVARKGRG